MSVRYVRSCGAGMPPPPRHCYYNITNLMLYINIKYGHFYLVMFYFTYYFITFYVHPYSYFNWCFISSFFSTLVTAGALVTTGSRRTWFARDLDLVVTAGSSKAWFARNPKKLGFRSLRYFSGRAPDTPPHILHNTYIHPYVRLLPARGGGVTFWD